MSWQGRISLDPKVLVGKPVVKGTRIAVELVVDLMAKGWTQEQILDSYPNLTAEDIRACLAYASEVLHAELTRTSLVRPSGPCGSKALT